MEMMFYKISAFVGVGVFLWLWSLKYGMKEYGHQPLRAVDALFLVVGIGMDEMLFRILPEYFGLFLDQIAPLSNLIYDTLQDKNAWVQVFAYVILGDFLAYWSHRWMHSKRMWQFHALHHSPKSLTWMASMRGSPIHFVLTNGPFLLAGMLCLITENMGVLVFLVVMSAMVQHLTHSNIDLPFAKVIERVMVTPRVHFVHHHPTPKYTNSNYGFVFTWWDRMFGTYSEPDKVEQKGLLGLDYEQSLISMFFGIRNPNTPEALKEKKIAA